MWELYVCLVSGGTAPQFSVCVESLGLNGHPPTLFSAASSTPWLISQQRMPRTRHRLLAILFRLVFVVVFGSLENKWGCVLDHFCTGTSVRSRATVEKEPSHSWEKQARCLPQRQCLLLPASILKKIYISSSTPSWPEKNKTKMQPKGTSGEQQID